MSISRLAACLFGSLLFALALVNSTGNASAKTCKGVWQTGGAVKITFRKNSQIRFCDRGKCRNRSYRKAPFFSEALVFSLQSGTSVVVSWIRGRYLISKKTSSTAKTIYAPLSCTGPPGPVPVRFTPST